MSHNALPGKQGLYDPRNEHDACGVGFIAHIKDRKSHGIVRQGLELLKNLTHRGAVGADPLAGDGAGILIQIPDAFLREQAAGLGIALPPVGEYGVGKVFLPRDGGLRARCEGMLEEFVRAEGQSVLGWRDVPVDNTGLGESVKLVEPSIRQVFIGRGANCRDQDAFERKLFVIRKQTENAVRALGTDARKAFYLPSCSSRTLVYKGMLLADQVGLFYQDLQDERMVSALALVHQRFSTNTFPTWDLAHPFRMIAHNGEINTVRGNINWMSARRFSMASELLGEDLNKVWPLIAEGQSDSACFDNALELLVTGGYGLAAISRPLLMLASSWPIVLGLRFLDRVGKGLRTSPRDAMLAAAVTDGQRGLAFGLQRAMDNAGAVIGPLVATGLLAAHVPIETIFLWTVVPGAAAVSLTLFLKEPTRELRFEAKAFDWSPAALPPAYKRYLWVLALFTLGNSSNMFLLLRARELGMPEYQIPLLWGVASLVAALFSTYLSGLSDRIGRVRMIVAGWTVYALFYLALGLNAASTSALWPLFAFYGLFMAATEGTEKALVADLAPAALLGTAYGWFNLTTGILLLPASFVFGALWQNFDSETAFGFAAGCAFLAALLLKYRIGRDLTCHTSGP